MEFKGKGLIDPDDEYDRRSLEKTNFPIVTLSINLMRDPREILSTIYLPAMVYALLSVKVITLSMPERIYNISIALVALIGL